MRKNSRKTSKNSRKIIKKNVGLPIEDLPKELLTEVFARVASASLTDIFNAKLSCKLLNEIAEDQHIYRHVSLDNFSIVPWFSLSEKQEAFLTRCHNSENPELLYRQAVIDYFSKRRLESALKCLLRAINSGHVGALYVTCIVLLFNGDDESKEKGIELLGGMRKSKNLRRKLRDCRNNLIKNLGKIWVKNQDLNQRPICCHVQDGHKKKMSWDREEYEESLECVACSADFEIKSIFEVLPTL